jgi:hypothetical protein
MRIALVGALIAALGVGGCGRKGSLDPPPGSSLGWLMPSADSGAPLPGGLLKWLRD